MEYLLVLAVAFVILVVPLWALARTFRLRRNSATRDELANLTRRVFELEQRTRELRDVINVQAPAGQPTPEHSAKTAPVPSAAAPSAPPRVVPPPVPAPPAPPPKPPAFAPAPPAPPRAPVIPPTEPAPAAKAEDRRRRWADLEERLTTNWMNKVGAAVLVIGVAYLLNYSMEYFGPAGKIALGYALGTGLLVTGIIGEKKENYRIIARALIGAGWALAYFTTYALHNIDAVRLVESAALGFFLLFAVAAAMVAHSLRYNSEVVTGFAYLLAFASVAVSQKNLGALAATAVLAASLVVILWRRGWYILEPLAVVATYALHRAWLGDVFNLIGGHKPFPEAKASVAILTAYWLIFTVSHYQRKEGGARERFLLTVSFLLNAAGYLYVLRYQALYPELRFWFLLGAGAAYLALAFMATRMGRRLGFLLASTLGATLVAVAIPYRYSGARLELIWLAEAQALLFIGWRAADAHLRRLGWMAASALVVYVMFHDISPRLAVWRPPDWPLGWLLLGIAAAFFVNSRLAPRLLGDDATPLDEAMGKILTPVATMFLMAAVWVALPMMWTALVWVGIVVALREAGVRLDDFLMRGCSHGVAAVAVLRLLSVNLQYAPPFPVVNLRLLTVAASAAVFYLMARRLAASVRNTESVPASLQNIALHLPAAYSWSATSLVTLLVWHEITNAAIALAWGLLGLALVEVGRALKDKPLDAQGHALLILSFARIFFADLNAEAMLGPISARLVSIAPLAAMFYYTAHTAPPERPRTRTTFYWMGTIALVSLLRFELLTEWVAVGWAALCVALFLAGRRLDLAPLRQQSYALALLVGMRCAFDNFYQTGDWAFTNVRTVTVVAASALLYMALGFALRGRKRATAPEGGDA
ncbi:MAG TPA: DUF2339 domain-containing protein [Candidatus Acidoferrales bacterium]